MIARGEDYTRVLVGANTFADATVALKLIGCIARNWKTRLGGILVEDAVPLAICARPKQRIVLASGEFALAPTRAQISTFIEADARAFRASLSRLAEEMGVPWTFERGFGDLIQNSLNMASAWDVFVFAHRNDRHGSGKVVLIGSFEPPDDRIVSISLALAQELSVDRMVFTIYDRAGNEDEATPKQSATGAIQFQTLDGALSRLARLNAQAVLLDVAQGPVCSPKDIQKLIEAARCPVFVFGPSSVEPRLERATQTAPTPKE